MKQIVLRFFVLIVLFVLLVGSTANAGPVTLQSGTINVNNSLYVDQSGKVGIGTINPSQKLDVIGGNIRSDTGFCIGGNCISSWQSIGGGGSGLLQSGTIGQTLRYDGTNWVASSLLSNGGNDNIVVQNNNEVYLNLKNTEAGGGQYALVSAGSSGQIGVGKFSVYDKTLGISRLTIDSSGNIGIGTTNPTQKLHVVGTTQADVLRLGDTGGNDIFWEMKETPTNDFSLNYGSYGEYLRINYINGGVGIGTTNPNPSYKLDVVGGGIHATGDICTDAVAGGKCLSASGSGGSGSLPSGTAGQTLRYDGTNWVASSLLSNGGNDNIVVQNNNEVYLNLKNTEAGGGQYALVSAGSSGGIGVGKFSIYDKTAGGNSRLTIDSSGNVGIGTTNPGNNNKLEVNANIVAKGGSGYSAGNYIGLFKDTGSLPGNPSDSYPTLKTDYAYLYFSAAGVYSAFLGSGPNTVFGLNGGSGGGIFLNTNGNSFLMGGNVGIGTTNPSEKLHVVGGNIRSDTGFCIGSSCIATWPSGGSSSQWTTSGSNIYYNTGNVGIGTTSPGAKLDVFQSQTGNYAKLTRSDAPQEYLAISGVADSGIGTGFRFQTQKYAGGPYTAMDVLYLGATGKVGIGIINPTATLQVGSAGSAANSFYDMGAGKIAVGTSLYSYGGICAGEDMGDCTGSGGVIISGGAVRGTPNVEISGNGVSYFNSGSGVGIGTTNPGTAKLAIAGGDVGIGTTSPGAKLDVFQSQTGNYAKLTRSDAPQEYLAISGVADSGIGTGFRFQTQKYAGGPYTAMDVLYLGATGKVGIGTTNPSYKLDVVGGNIRSDTGFCIGSNCITTWPSGGSSSQWTTSGSNIYYSTGNVGIGTTSPGAKLNIGGATDATGLIISSGSQTTTGTWTGLAFSSYNSANYWTAIRSITTATDPDYYKPRLGFFTQAANTYLPAGLTERLSILADSGNVGIGTTNPSQKLEVAGQIKLSGTGNGIVFPDNTVQTTAATGGSGSSQWTTSGSNIYYSTGGVGIGTSTPGARAHIDTGSPLVKGLIIKGSASVTSPNTITGLKLWLKADAITGLNDGDTVSTWYDSSGAGNNAVTGSAPRYKVNQINSKPALQFYGNYLDTPAFIAQQVFVVFSSPNAAFNNYGSPFGVVNYNSGRSFIFESGQTYFHSNQYPSAVWKNGNSLSSPFNLVPITSYMIITVNTANPYNTRAYRIGGTDDWRNWLNIAEIIAYDNVLADADRIKVESYLSQKYGISITGATNNQVANLQEWQDTTGSVLSVVNPSGYIGIGTTSPSQKLHVAGTIRQSDAVNCGLNSNANGDITCTSDVKLKNIKGDYTNGLNTISNIHPIRFNFKGENYTHVGFSAQDVQKVLPEATSLQKDGYLGLDTNAVVAALVDAVKTQQSQIQAQQLQIKELQDKVSKLEKK